MRTFLQIVSAVKNYGNLTLFDKISLTVNEGDKVALVARNGTGKTSLLNVLAGKDDFDEGSLFINPDIKTGYLEQDPRFDPELTLFGAVYSAPGILMQSVREYELALTENNQKKLEAAVLQMDFHKAWDFDAKIKQMLGVLKLEDVNQIIRNLSGGQLKRLALVVTLINNPDFVILDEPTNHLDIEMIEWLEEYLKRSGLTVLMVTHDRYFLERICNEIIEIDEGHAYSYKGNYTAFLEKRNERILNKTLNVEKARNLMRRELEWIRRMPKARGTKAKSRIDAFYDLKKQSEYNRHDKNININIKSTRLGKKILIVDKVSKGYNDIIILNDFSYTFSHGEKVGIIGANGTGKTTFLDIITGTMPPDKGNLEQGETVNFGYFRQKGPEFKPEKKVIEVIRDIAEIVALQDGQQFSVIQFLNRFLFTPDMHNLTVEKLSGGEKRRLYLMTVLMLNPNFLILDEPTNDFDIVTLNILEEYLKDFSGCLIIVSHDRFFMDKIVDHLFIFEGNGVVFDFPGSYSDYRASAKQSQNAASGNSNKIQRDRKTGTEINIVRKKKTFKEKQEFEQLTTEIRNLEKEKAELEEAMNSGQLNSEQLHSASRRIAVVLATLDQKSDRWLELSE